MTETAKLEALKPCPFCGASNPRKFNNPDEFGRPSHGIQCTGGGCAICGPEAETENEAITAWNTRALSRPAVKGLEWVEVTKDQWQANTPFGLFAVCNQPMFGKAWRTFTPSGWPTFNSDDAEELKRVTSEMYVQRILSSLSPPTGGWKPIESAPKAGAEFQAWIVADASAAEFWEPKCRLNPESEAFEIWGRVDYDADGWATYPYLTPTHWQPLPSPPEAE